ncbi:MAG: hypothetical protein IJT16_03245 [Lachnospiraceae bacterium]|nr:hypothetical protein [Lachnospiraceae bacterium]
MKTRTFAALFTAVLVFSLTACTTSSSSTTTVSTSFTDENGETTTHTTTTTTEKGQTSTQEETTTSAAEEAPAQETVPYEADESDVPTLRDVWADYFEYGAEGYTNEEEMVFFTYDDPDNMSQAALMIVDPEGWVTIYDIGNVRMDGDYYVIEDIDGDVELPFLVTDAQDDHFEMTFQDNSYAELYYVDKDQIINDMVSIIEDIQQPQAS